MRKNKEYKTVRQEGTGIRILIILGFIVVCCLLVAGIVLMGVYFKNFDMYVKLSNSWSGGPGFNDYVNSHNSYYESNKGTDGSTWVYASYSLFVTGLALAAVGIIGITLLSVALSKNKKKHPNLSLKGTKVPVNKVTEKKEPVKQVVVQGPNNF